MPAISRWPASPVGVRGTTPAVSLEKEDAMWIVYLVVGVVGLVFCVLSLASLESESA